MQDKLLAEFPDVTYESWREQVEKDLKGADFEKRLVTRTLEGLVVQPLYTARDVVPAADRDPGGFAGLPPYQRGASAVGNHGPRWDIRAEQQAPELARAKTDIAEDLGGGARSLWLRFDARARLGASGEGAAAGGLMCRAQADLAALLADVDLARVSVTLDAGGAVVGEMRYDAYGSPRLSARTPMAVAPTSATPSHPRAFTSGPSSSAAARGVPLCRGARGRPVPGAHRGGRGTSCRRWRAQRKPTELPSTAPAQPQ
jgi:methylmalonyl-CoA mutase